MIDERVVDIVQFDLMYNGGIIRAMQVAQLAAAAGMTLAPNAPIVGERIFAHESGVHADGMMKHGSAYEPFDAEEVGCTREFPIGKHSGTGTILYHLNALGITAEKHSLSNLLPRIREIVTSRKRVLDDAELMTLYRESMCL
jgi:homocitrate synthase NifV